VTHGEISRLENRPDIYASTLRRYVQAMNGQIEIVAHFPGRPNVRVSLGKIEQSTPPEEEELVARR
jgi:hypothetical protein